MTATYAIPEPTTQTPTTHRRTTDTYLPWETTAHGGLGGPTYFDDHTATRETPPLVFVHGNGRDATDWLPLMRRFLDNDYSPTALWAITFAQETPTHREMAAQLEPYCRNVRRHTGADQLVVVGHSLGVTGARYWLQQYDRHDWLTAFIGLAGANHGTYAGSFGELVSPDRQTREISRFLNPFRMLLPYHPLSQLNRNETPGDADYYTIRASDDRFFPWNPRSPRLCGATANIEVAGTHDELLDPDVTFPYLSEWVPRN